MYRIKNVEFKNHPVLGSLHLDFCGLDGKPVDTVIIAGENGTGKSTILNTLFAAVNFYSQYEMKMTVIVDGKEKVLNYRFNNIDNNRKIMFVRDENDQGYPQEDSRLKGIYGFHAIFSDVAVNFWSQNDIKSVTSSELDSNENSQRSSSDLATQIKQLIVDVQAADDADTAISVRNVGNTTKDYNDIVQGFRMQRFVKAFSNMFDYLYYDKVETVNNRKSIVFNKNGCNIDIDALSSGEKQIVYRGCFLLKDRNALDGAFVFIDEPEISLHPNWQKKILDFYKSIFSDGFDNQNSQLFIVTHSPFIIHNTNRSKDKVIVLCRDEFYNITVLDKPEYYDGGSVESVKDAFSINDFTMNTSKSIVYLEGRTDEKYFKKALEVFEIKNPKFEFQWVGHLNNDKEEFTGSTSLNYAIQFMKGNHPEKPQFFIYDCDVNKSDTEENNIIVINMPKYDNSYKMNKGIENALVLDEINVQDFYTVHSFEKDYGQTVTNRDFEKMKMCDYICDLPKEKQERILQNLKPVIEKIIKRINKESMDD